MNRYTYKSKSKDNNEWIYGLPIRKRDLTFNNEYDEFYAIQDDFFEEYRIDEQTLSQCTGLQDRDGKDIFENDKIRGLRHHNKKYVIIEGFVEYNEFLARYDVSGNYYNGNQLSAFKNVEIIGNKFDKEVE